MKPLEDAGVGGVVAATVAGAAVQRPARLVDERRLTPEAAVGRAVPYLRNRLLVGVAHGIVAAVAGVDIPADLHAQGHPAHVARDDAVEGARVEPAVEDHHEAVQVVAQAAFLQDAAHLRQAAHDGRRLRVRRDDLGEVVVAHVIHRLQDGAVRPDLAGEAGEVGQAVHVLAHDHVDQVHHRPSRAGGPPALHEPAQARTERLEGAGPATGVRAPEGLRRAGHRGDAQLVQPHLHERVGHLRVDGRAVGVDHALASGRLDAGHQFHGLRVQQRLPAAGEVEAPGAHADQLVDDAARVLRVGILVLALADHVAGRHGGVPAARLAHVEEVGQPQQGRVEVAVDAAQVAAVAQ